SLVKKHFGPGKRAPLDLTPFRQLLEGDAVPVEFDGEKVWGEFEGRLLQGPRPPLFVEGVSRKALRRLTASAFVLKLRAGDLVTGEGIEERELFLILDGTFEVVRGGRELARLGPGELFGDIAFFTRAGERSATVRALTDGRLLVLRRKFLQE